MDSKQPIGIFDSGIGGLTIAKALVSELPNEDIVYFGDTAHLPYGDKSTAAIQSYALKITQMLLNEGCKLILIACNSASVAAYNLVTEYVTGRALVVNVIDPVIEHVAQNYAKRKIGLIGTKQTINSNIYQKRIDDLALQISLYACATPLLASAIEEGFGGTKVMRELLREYLSDAGLAKIDALILGCTHYPLVKEQIAKVCGRKTEVLDASSLVAGAVRELLLARELLNGQQEIGSRRFLVSDYTEVFAANTKLFFGDAVTLSHYPLWG